MVSLFAAQIDLALQTVIFILLVTSIALIRLKKIKPHAGLMLTAFAVNLLAFIIIMAPSFGAISMAMSTIAITTFIHAAIGALTILSSLWVLGTWLFPSVLRQNPKLRCYGKFNKRLMIAVTILWLTAILLGILLYFMLYTTALGTLALGS